MEENQYLTFYIGEEIFALDVLKIDEIIPYSHITYIPRMQPFVKGVMNIRGKIIPIICLNKRLELDVNMDNKKQSIIIVSLDYDGEINDIGIVVSKVDQVFTIHHSDLELAPAFGSKISKNFIHSIAKFNNEFVSILDIDEILNLKDLSTTLQDMV